MPYPKDPTVYPPEFASLFRRALSESFEIDFEDHGVATNYCHRLHAYRRACENVKLPGWASLRNTQLLVRGTRLIFKNSKQAQDLIRAAAGIEAPSEEQIDKYLAQLEQGDTDHDGQLNSKLDSPGEGGREEEAEEARTPAQNWQEIFSLPTNSEDQE